MKFLREDPLVLQVKVGWRQGIILGSEYMKFVGVGLFGFASEVRC